MEFEWDSKKSKLILQNEKQTKKKRSVTMSISKQRLKKLSALKDSDIDYSDVSKLDAKFWRNAKLIEPATKKAVSIRLDNDILEWFKEQGKGYQSLMNSVLKTFVQAKRNKHVR